MTTAAKIIRKGLEAEIQRKQFSADLTAVEGERAVIARISTESIDRDGDVMLASGCDTTDFQKSPTVFFSHDYAKPVGRCDALRTLPGRMMAKTVFATRPADHVGEWLPDTLFSLYQQGVVNGFSVGFKSTEARRATPDDREAFGPGVKQVISRWKLLEYSVAPIPVNQDAIAVAVSKGVVTRELAAAMSATAGGNPAGYSGGGELRLSNRQLEAAIRAMRPVLKSIIHELLDPERAEMLTLIAAAAEVAAEKMMVKSMGSGCGHSHGYGSIDDLAGAEEATELKAEEDEAMEELAELLGARARRDDE